MHESSLNVPILGVKPLVVSNEKTTSHHALVEHSPGMHKALSAIAAPTPLQKK